MKTKGLFTECTLTSKLPIISGKTSDGLAIYADPKDLEKGFQMFRNYKLKIFDDGKDIPYHGFCYRSKIIRLPMFDFGQIPEWLRLERLKAIFSTESPEIKEAIAKVEGVIPERVLATDSIFDSTLQA